MTGPRRTVLVALTSLPGHPTLDEIVGAVQQLDPVIHRDSVVRSLDTFTGLGVVQLVPLDRGGTAYHLVHGHAHAHARCRQCGGLTDLPDDLLAWVSGQVLGRTGFVLEPGDVALSGVCAGCASGQK